jgi:serine/threonine-protein kinase RsbW
MTASNSLPLSWEKTIPSRLPALMRAIDELNLFLAEQSADAVALHRTQLVLEEMGTNVIKYGFDQPGEHPMTLRAQCVADFIELTLVDGGHAFDPRQASEPDPEAALEERTPGGWGISLVRRLVTEMDYQRIDGTNVLTLKIPRTGAAEAF